MKFNSLEEVMLDSNAEELTKQELPEILPYLTHLAKQGCL